jgi:HD-GYP domain-containing protein (c-di-GMP phosphodiesterase class II)
MKTIKISALVPGMIVAKDIFDASGLLMLNEGTILSTELIKKLEYWGLDETYIEEPSPSLREQQEQAIIPQMKIAHERAINLTGSLLSKPELGDGDSLIFKGMIGDIASQIDLNSNILLNLSHLKTHDDYLYSHAVNVSIVAMIIGRELRMNESTLKNLGLAALLHDVGMVRIDKSIYNKDGQLNDEEWAEIKRHPEYGYEMLSGNEDFDEEVLLGVKQHHERINGKGYPEGRSGDNIHLFGKIIAISDVYDACISSRKHRQRMTAYEALRNLLGESALFDIRILKALVTSMAIYPIGSYIRLNTGEVAKVIGINHGFPFRPEIRIYLDRSRNKLEKPVRINLTDEEYTQTYIQETLNHEESEEMYMMFDNVEN